MLEPLGGATPSHLSFPGAPLQWPGFDILSFTGHCQFMMAYCNIVGFLECRSKRMLPVLCTPYCDRSSRGRRG